MSARFVYITASSEEEAASIGKRLVEERLAACANVISTVRSFYWGEGKIQEGQEAVLIVKTREELMERLIDAVRSLHSYECPCVVSLPIVEGNPDFLRWIYDETGGSELDA